MTRGLTLALLLISGASAANSGLPITFEENRGQVVGEVKFLAHTSGYHLFLTRTGAAVTAEDGLPVQMNLAGSEESTPLGTHRLLAKTNYLIGSDPARWRTGIANYDEVSYPGVYAGIDMNW